MILTGYTDNMADVGDRCTATQLAYAQRRGYDFECVRHYHDRTHPSHQKIELLAERIHKYDGIMWMDADSLVTGDMDLETLRNGEHVMDISIDWCAPIDADNSTTYVSCGNFVLWNRPETKEFLREWAMKSERYATRNVCCWEQDGLRALIQSDERFNKMVRRWPRWVFNSVHHTCINRDFLELPPNPWVKGDFILHLTNVDRMAILQEMGH